MAAGRTGSAGSRALVPEWHFPTAKLGLVVDQVVIGRAMGVVAQHAATAFISIDVHSVQVLITIPEAGSSGIRLLDKVTFVTVETKREAFLHGRRIRTRRKGFR